MKKGETSSNLNTNSTTNVDTKGKKTHYIH